MNTSSSRHEPGSLERRLTGLGFMELFQRLDQHALDEVWQHGAARAPLEALALDVSAAALARFLAAEILFVKAPKYPPRRAAKALADVYARALAEQLTGMANPWGLPGEPDEATARHAIVLGKSAVPAFEQLLDDKREVHYGGSREATVGNQYRYRVKDVAAALIEAIRGEQVDVKDLDPVRRDSAIGALRARLREDKR